MVMRKRRRAGERPVWAANPVDASADQIQPYPGWVLLDEQFIDDEVKLSTGLLAVARPYDHHTMYARVDAIHPVDEERLGVKVGDLVLFKEWSGGKWLFNGDQRLLTNADDILGIVEEHPSR